MDILCSKSEPLTLGEIQGIMDEELEKSPEEMDTNLVDLCLNTLIEATKNDLKVAVVGSRTVFIDNLGDYLPEGTTEIVSGGARGVDTCARKYAMKNNLNLTEFLPEYEKYGRAAPIKRNKLIVDYADMVIAFWDGKSRGTKSVVDYCKKIGKEIKINII